MRKDVIHKQNFTKLFCCLMCLSLYRPKTSPMAPDLLSPHSR